MLKPFGIAGRTYAISWPHPSLEALWQEIGVTGSTEPWTLQLVSALLTACNAKRVLEVGTYRGFGSAWLLSTLEAADGGDFIGIEHEAKFVEETTARLQALNVTKSRWVLAQGDSVHAITRLPKHGVDFVWLDSDHTVEHTERELEALIDYEVVAPRGIICGHDMYGLRFSLADVFKKRGGLILKLPQWHMGGGLGVIQC